MRYPPTYQELQYLLFGFVVLFVLFTTARVTPGGERHPWSTGDCESCHTGMQPAVVVIELDQQGDLSYELRAIVSNVEKHQVKELEARLLNTNDSQAKQGPDLEKNDEYTFSWSLSNEEAQQAGVRVDLLARHEHGGKGPDKQAYTFKYDHGKQVQESWGRDWDFGLGQALGLTMAALVIGACLTGLYQSGRLRVPEWVGGSGYGYREAGHKLTGLVLLGLAIPHALLLQLGLYRGTTGGLFGGLMTLIGLVLLTVVTLERKRLLKRWGWKTWVQVHRVLVIGFILLFLSHVFQISSHLSPD